MITPNQLETDRDNAIKWARKLFEGKEFVILDTETTGLDSAAEIIEIAIIDHEGRNKGSARIKPSERAVMDERAFAVHGISMDELANERPITDFAEDIKWSIHGKTVVAYNAAFDYRMLLQSFAAHQANPPEVLLVANFECAMLKYSAFVGDWNLARGQYRLQKLPFAVHGSLADARAVLAVLQLMAHARLSDESDDEFLPLDDDELKQYDKDNEPTPAPIRVIAFEHGTGSVTLGPPPTAPAEEAHEEAGDDPAANGYTFNLFEAEPVAGKADEGQAAHSLLTTNRAGLYAALINLLSGQGITGLTPEIVTTWSEQQISEAIEWAGQMAVAAIDLALCGLGSFPPRLAFFPPTPTPDENV